MKDCWNEKPEKRPSFTELRTTMKAMSKENAVTPTFYLNRDECILTILNLKQTGFTSLV